MAVDSKAKRFSMLSFGSRALLPDPDAGGIEAGDRLHLLGLYGGILAGEPIAPVVELPIGAGKKDNQPTSELISPLDYRRGWKEHIRAAEQTMWDKQRGVEKARKFDVPRHEPEAPKRKPKGIQTPERERTPKPEPVNRLETNRPEQKTLEIQPSEKQIVRPKKRTIRRTDERLVAANEKASEVREENRFQAHLKATEGLVKSENIKEEKRQRIAEKDIGYTPTQIKRDRANRKKLYEQRTSNMVNLEKAKRERAKIQAVEEVNRKEMLKRMKKVRAAKKRKKK